MSQLFLGLDLGTSGCRGVVIDKEGVTRAEHSVLLPPSVRQDDGQSEQNPQDWLKAVIMVCQAVCQQLGDESDAIASIAIDGTSSTLLAADQEGNPLSSALMYDDRQATDEATELSTIAPSDSPVLPPSSSLAKLLYLKKKVAQKFIALHQADWLLGQLCGVFGISDENNALKMGYDPINRCWPEWIEQLQLEDGTLPAVYPVATAMGTIKPEMAEQIGLPTNTLVCTGTTDSTASAIATGIDHPGQGVTVLGSTLVIKLLSEKPIFSSPHGIYSHRLGDLWLVGGASNSGGAVLLNYFCVAELAEMAPRLKPDQPTGLDYYPLSRPGERFPHNDPDYPPRQSPRPQDDVMFFQAMLEGIANIEAEAYQLLQDLGGPVVSEVLTIGGGSVNEPWRQIRQQRLNLPVNLAKQTEAAYGAAILAKRGFFSVNQ